MNCRKVRKNSRKDLTAPKRIFETFCTQEAPRCIGMNATLTTLYLIHKIKQGFSYTIFYVKKINVGKVLKLLENCCFIILSIHVPKLEISGCDRDIIEHTLETDVKITPKKQNSEKCPKKK
jgi:hypothetical protein